MRTNIESIALFVCLVAINYHTNAQTTAQKIGANPTAKDASALLELEATNKGFLMPRVALTGLKDVSTIANAAHALTVFNTVTTTTGVDDVTPGYYYWSKDTVTPANSKWVRLLDANTPGVEPWNNQADNTPATANTQNIYQMGKVAINKAANYVGASGNPTVLDAEGAIRGGTNQQGVVGTNSIAVGSGLSAEGENSAIFGSNNRADMANTFVTGVNNSVLKNNGGANGTALFGSGNVYSAPLGNPISENNTMFGRDNQFIPRVNGTDNNTVFGRNNVILGLDYPLENVTVFGRHNSVSSPGAADVVTPNNATVFGEYNIAERPNQFVIGSSNFRAENALFEIGIGTHYSTDRRNAVTVLTNGNTGIGAGATAPHSTLQVAGSFALPIKSITADYTVTDLDYKILVRTTTGSTAITLPDPTTCKGRIYVIQNMVGNGVTLNYDVEIGGSTTITPNTQFLIGAYTASFYQSGFAITLQSDGTVWIGITL